jgi:glycosyltransferase involved in cell wall biosynthesis
VSADVTVGIPVYNAARTLCETLDALQAQTYRDLEILVSDNASTDETPDILASYARRDPRLRVIRQPHNRGAIENFQAVIEAARTPFFTWFAADDVCAPPFVERTRAALLANPAAIIAAADVCITDESGVPKRIVRQPDVVGLSAEARMHRHMASYGWYATYGVGRREALLACGPFAKSFGADVIKTAEWMLAGDVVRVPEPLFLFRERSGGKDPATYAAQFDPGSRAAAKPHTDLLRGVSDAIRRAGLGRDELTDVLAAVVRAVALENRPFIGEVLREQELAGTDTDDLARLRLVGAIVGAHDGKAA